MSLIDIKFVIYIKYMPKETFIARFSLIIRRLEKGPATYDEIAEFLRRESEIQDKNFSISIRTLQRDIKDIYTQLNIEIVNEKTGDKRYYIKSKNETNDQSIRLLESYQIIQAINASQEFSNKVFIETRQPKGLEHFYDLLFAINNRRVIQFTHYKYWEDIEKERKVHPLALKESLGRWYLLAVDTKDNKCKTFGLDRISWLDIQESKFREKYHYNFKEWYTNAFGIIKPEDGLLEIIQLKYQYEQGQYVKTYPLHHSQKVILENNDEVIIELHLYITYDFIRELLSYGSELEVLQPLSLRKRILHELMESTKKYQ